MDKLEEYVERICLRMGGPRALRAHVRQELREHLTDAVDEHRRAGMSEEQALERALLDFGGPEEVRKELEAAHGQRMTAVIVEKAMQWKEKTMKERWLWSTWAHLAMAAVIAVEVLFLYAATIFIYPKYQELAQDGWVNWGEPKEFNAWATNVLGRTDYLCSNPWWILGVLGALWIFFEWRERGENKMLIRLAAMGTVSIGLLIAVCMVATALIVSLIIAIHPVYHAGLAKRIAHEQFLIVETSSQALDRAAADGNWEEAGAQTQHARRALELAWSTGALIPISPYDLSRPLQAQLRSARDALNDAQIAVSNHDAARLSANLRRFHEAYDKLRAGPTTQEN